MVREHFSDLQIGTAASEVIITSHGVSDTVRFSELVPIYIAPPSVRVCSNALGFGAERPPSWPPDIGHHQSRGIGELRRELIVVLLEQKFLASINDGVRDEGCEKTVVSDRDSYLVAGWAGSMVLYELATVVAPQDFSVIPAAKPHSWLHVLCNKNPLAPLSRSLGLPLFSQVIFWISSKYDVLCLLIIFQFQGVLAGGHKPNRGLYSQELGVLVSYKGLGRIVEDHGLLGFNLYFKDQLGIDSTILIFLLPPDKPPDAILFLGSSFTGTCEIGEDLFDECKVFDGISEREIVVYIEEVIRQNGKMDGDGVAVGMHAPLLELREKRGQFRYRVEGSLVTLQRGLRQRSEASSARELLELSRNTFQVVSKVEKLIRELISVPDDGSNGEKIIPHGSGVFVATVREMFLCIQ